jgi:two-component system, chemotaxis family, protein-glutamate methylesterase/glutaminase
MSDEPIRVLLVDDSPLVLAMLKRILLTDPAFEVVGTASNGKEALQKRATLRPTLISADYEMPVMDGLELVRTVMQTDPLPILVVSSIVDDPTSERVLALLDAGAVDVFPKPRAGFVVDGPDAKDYLRKLRIVARVKTFKRRSASPVRAPSADPEARKLVLIGASTGGPPALQQLFSTLAPGFALPIVCVQHISPGFLPGMVEWLGAQCPLPVALARHGELPRPGRIYFAPEGTHLQFDARGQFQLTVEPQGQPHCPSVDIAFQSAAEQLGAGTVAVLLTGMGRDGAAGIAAVARAGGVTVAQSETSAAIFGMPREAIATGQVQHVLALLEIGALLQSF